MDKLKTFIKNYQQTIVLTIGYLLVASLGFGLGRFTAFKYEIPEIRVESSFAPLNNYSGNVSGAQTQSATDKIDQGQPEATISCEGKIKGSTSKIYHLPGGDFYKRTTKPIRCFDTEAEAKAAGFRKSTK
jgi:hypothetical protein